MSLTDGDLGVLSGRGSVAATRSHGAASARRDTTGRAAVREWLTALLSRHGADVPAFEDDERAWAALSSLAAVNAQRDADAEVLTKHLNLAAEEYASEAARMEALLEPVGLLPRDLSASGTTSLQLLSSAAVYLGINEPTVPRYCMALADVSKRMHKLSQRAMAIRREADVLETQLQEAVAYRASMHRELERMQEEAAAQQEGEEGLPAMESSLAKLTAKREAYQAETVKLRAVRDGALGGRDELLHEELVAKSKVVDALAERAEVVRQQLRAFADLPPDKVRAQEMLEEARAEVERLTEEFADAAAAHDPFAHAMPR